ncbi:uncharacterized protein Z518_02807 [Rhinocladiella mackenziei CBS 650.93]|uniref:Glutaredoxin-like protein n=1 Tax=Rhinocladiella mackenziei CBS 650.93 TaxID=1442369 RepID=A0A0D2IXQ7_9EURO|nr:uncharacterized protein Z518_02807 [Rhinocladiella mackenziei CBS 650.93]KIX08151.1 hypothetical protein Z518_02807 [Rhinocladiella mackenziei CBS 650.93]
MRSSLALRVSGVRLTLFTRANCGLCNVAKARIDEFQKKCPRPINYSEIDIMDSAQQKWRDVYEFDVPVLHVDRVADGTNTHPTLEAAKKLMHRFTVEEVERAAAEVEQTSSS